MVVERRFVFSSQLRKLTNWGWGAVKLGGVGVKMGQRSG
jgi:hypothetical protein